MWFIAILASKELSAANSQKALALSSEDTDENRPGQILALHAGRNPDGPSFRGPRACICKYTYKYIGNKKAADPTLHSL